MRVVPGDPVTVLAQGSPLTTAQRDALRHEYHLDQPIPVQYISWLGGALRGDFGRSLTSGQPVAGLIWHGTLVTALLLAGGFVVALTLSVPLAIVAARRAHTWKDQGIISATILLLSIPLFVTCVVAIYVFVDVFGVLPAFGTGLGEGVVSVFRHMLLPWITLGIALCAVQTATLRAGLIESANRQWVLIARSRGLSSRIVFARHILRAALVPFVTLLGLQFGYMIVGSVFVDDIFGLGGLGFQLVNAVEIRDMPTVQAIVMVIAVAFTFSNLFADVLAAKLDPRYSFS
jgi:peptide/nickel transport system permease protein